MLAISARQLSATANSLLRTSDADSYDRGLARQIGKIAALAERITLELDPSSHGNERTATQLRKLGAVLDEISAAGSLAAKRQDRFADELRDRRHKLLDSFDRLEPLPAAAPKADAGKTAPGKALKPAKRGR